MSPITIPMIVELATEAFTTGVEVGTNSKVGLIIASGETGSSVEVDVTVAEGTVVEIAVTVKVGMGTPILISSLSPG